MASPLLTTSPDTVVLFYLFFFFYLIISNYFLCFFFVLSVGFIQLFIFPLLLSSEQRNQAKAKAEPKPLIITSQKTSIIVEFLMK